MLHEPEDNPDGGFQLQERWQILGAGQILNDVLRGNPQSIVDALILEVQNGGMLLQALLNRLKDVQLMATICASTLQSVERIKKQVGDDNAWGLINNLFMRLEDLGIENRIELEFLYYLLTNLIKNEPQYIHDALLATASCLVAQVKMEPGEVILNIASELKQGAEKSELTDDPEMLNDFTELIKIGSCMKNNEVYETLIQILIKDKCELWQNALMEGDGASIVELMEMFINVDMPWAHRLLSLAISNCQDIEVLEQLIAIGSGFGRYWDDIIWAFVRHPRASEFINTKNEDFLMCIIGAAKKAGGREKIMHELRQLILQYGPVETLPENIKMIFIESNLITV